ncbi:hypothetical protein [Variovorax sp. OV329]|uniref:hypothetical protein n=1 Tax=Variovorax sp. OV329 TaxID=1882825 RepID=UPI000B84FF11|nr:hypothetical protein [Variovorax sp. OV329]
MKASPAARSWIAAGVRHELLTRVLPALRHDMVGPVSVMRMGMLMLKRQVESPHIDAQACSERVALIESQIGELIEGVRLLRNWELATSDEGIARSALVQLCVSLLRPAFSLQGVQLDVAPELEQPTADDEPRWPRAAALRYLLLCGLNYLHDASPEEPTVISIAPEAEDGLLLRMGPAPHGELNGNAMSEAAVVHRAPRALAIDAVALQGLADDLGYEISVGDDSTVRIRLGAD